MADHIVDMVSAADQFSGLDLLPCQVAVLDLHGAIVFVNEAWQSFAAANNAAHRSFIGINYLDVCEGAEGPEQTRAVMFAQYLRDVLKGKYERFDFTYPCHAPDRERWFKATVTRRDHYVLVSHFDITQEYAQIAEAGNNFWNYAAVHELKTPLNSIIGFADLAFNETQQGSGQVSLSECLKTIQKSSRHMLNIVNDVLQSTRQTEVFDEDLPLADFIDEVCAAHREALRQRDIDLHIRIDKRYSVRGDLTKLTKVMNNLLSNAIKYSWPGGWVLIDANINLSEGIEVRILDNGIGIPVSQINSVFDPFQRATGQAEVEKREGTGLGLAVVRNLIRAHGGDVRVSSQEGEGSCFTVMFPKWRSRVCPDETAA